RSLLSSPMGNNSLTVHRSLMGNNSPIVHSSLTGNSRFMRISSPTAISSIHRTLMVYRSNSLWAPSTRRRLTVYSSSTISSITASL
ncbi:MAG: hypothetical protein K2N00_08475, partial [Lachnospiraceae bacterium]|nr:hypothetical protein [Lachnospiraceae bacterium]